MQKVQFCSCVVHFAGEVIFVVVVVEQAKEFVIAISSIRLITEGSRVID